MRSRYLILIVLFLVLFNGYLVFRALVPHQEKTAPTTTPTPASQTKSNGYDRITISSEIPNVKPQLTMLNNVYYALQATDVWKNGALFIPKLRRVPIEYIDIKLVKDPQYIVLTAKKGENGELVRTQSFSQEYNPPKKTLILRVYVTPSSYEGPNKGSLDVSNATAQALFQSAIQNPTNPKENDEWTKIWNEYVKRMGEAYAKFVQLS